MLRRNTALLLGSVALTVSFLESLDDEQLASELP